MAIKKPAAVVAAEAAEAEKKAAWDAAAAAAKQAEQDYYAACRASREARIAADADLPQCKMVDVRWRTDKAEEAGRVVILRKTPGGLLVVRRVGDAEGDFRFKWNKHRGIWQQAEKGSYAFKTRELRDVPDQYMPQEATA